MVLLVCFAVVMPSYGSPPKQWNLLGSGEMDEPERKSHETYDVAVVGGGIAGICAAVASARNGANTVLIQDRPVLGGNASSEMRVILNGAQSMSGKFAVDRETGIVEELQLENCYYNPQESWSMWDHVLYNYVMRQPNLTLKLNTPAIETIMDGDRISSILCRELVTSSDLKIDAKLFIDCTGDGIIAAGAGATYRTGRESRDEFDESYAPPTADGWVLGDAILLYAKDMGVPVKFEAPSYARKYDPSKYRVQKRFIRDLYVGYWWVELGSDFDGIADREIHREKLMGYLYGVWDYIKNSGEYPEAETLALDWVGSLPAPRESRRFMGDYILTQNDMLGYKDFEDAIAFGGWSLDEHCPGGIENFDDPPSFFHEHFERHYQIPYRILYSCDVPNLFFAGRNVSVTHIALSSTRIIGTCALLGQAAGTAAAICVENDLLPAQIYNDGYINELQEQLLRDDAYIPNRPAQDLNDLARSAKLSASSTTSGSADLLIDGYSRDEVDAIHHWESDGVGATLTLTWERAVEICEAVIKCNTNLQKTISLRPDPGRKETILKTLPPEMLKCCEVEILQDNRWVKVGSVEDNIHRLIEIKFAKVETTSLRFKLNETYGAPNVRLFEVRCY